MHLAHLLPEIWNQPSLQEALALLRENTFRDTCCISEVFIVGGLSLTLSRLLH